MTVELRLASGHGSLALGELALPLGQLVRGSGLVGWLVTALLLVSGGRDLVRAAASD